MKKITKHPQWVEKISFFFKQKKIDCKIKSQINISLKERKSFIINFRQSKMIVNGFIYLFFDYRMNSLISLLWQFEIPNIPIPVTILKNNQESPHHYFYSEKQNRVLRKKNPNAVAAIEQSQGQTKEVPPLILNTIRTLKQRTIFLELSTGLAAIQALTQKDFEGQYSIIPSNYELCLYTLTHGQTTIQYLTCSQPVRHNQILKKVSDFVANLCKSLVTNSKGKKLANINKVIEILLIIGIDSSNLQGKWGIIVIDALTLRFSDTDNLIEIKYTPKINPAAFQTKKPKQKDIKQQQLNKSVPKKQEHSQNIPQIFEEESPKKPTYSSALKKEKVSFSTCTCCNTEVESHKVKEVPNEEYKKLRKLKNMGIRGFNQEYYEICIDCYQLL